MHIKRLGRQVVGCPYFKKWSIQFGHNPNTSNDRQLLKNVKYYFAFIVGVPPESFKSVEMSKSFYDNAGDAIYESEGT